MKLDLDYNISMDQDKKLVVFEKKEVALLIVLVVILCISFFSLGVKIGKEIFMSNNDLNSIENTLKELKRKEEGMSSSEQLDLDFASKVASSKDLDREKRDPIKLKSVIEENYQKELESDDIPKVEVDKDKIALELKKEIEGILADKEKNISPENEENFKDSNEVNPAVDSEQDKLRAPEKSENVKNSLKGLYTIQVFASQSKEVAKDFASAFILKGYDVYIYDVELEDKGVWYRVSIGKFPNLIEAKNYLEKEKEFFQDEEFLIQQFE